MPELHAAVESAELDRESSWLETVRVWRHLSDATAMLDTYGVDERRIAGRLAELKERVRLVARLRQGVSDIGAHVELGRRLIMAANEVVRARSALQWQVDFLQPVDPEGLVQNWETLQRRIDELARSASSLARIVDNATAEDIIARGPEGRLSYAEWWLSLVQEFTRGCEYALPDTEEVPGTALMALIRVAQDPALREKFIAEAAADVRAPLLAAAEEARLQARLLDEMDDASPQEVESTLKRRPLRFIDVGITYNLAEFVGGAIGTGLVIVLCIFWAVNIGMASGWAAAFMFAPVPVGLEISRYRRDRRKAVATVIDAARYTATRLSTCLQLTPAGIIVHADKTAVLD